MHCPQSEQSVSQIFLLPFTPMVVRPPVPLTSQMLSDCTVSQTCTQRMHLMHLDAVRISGNPPSGLLRSGCMS